MDLKDLIAKMDAIERKGAVEPVMEIAPLIPLAIAGGLGYMAGQGGGNEDPGPAPTSIVPTHFHKRNIGPIQPLMMTKPGVFWWEATSSSRGSPGKEIQRWSGNTENRSALNPASVDGIYIDGNPVEFPEGVTWRTYVDPRKPQQDPNAPPTPVNGKCPDGWQLSPDGKTCVKAGGSQDTKPGQYLNVDPNLRAKFILLVNKVENKLKSKPAVRPSEEGPGFAPKDNQLPKSGDAAKNPIGSLNKDTAIPSGGLENPANRVKESISFNGAIAQGLVESFGYTLTEREVQSLKDLTAQDAKDAVRGAYNGFTFGAGDNITAGVKSAFGKDTYAQALAKEKAMTDKAKERAASYKFTDPIFNKEWNPSTYDAGELAGFIGSAAIPGVGLAGKAGQAVGKGVVRGVAGTGKVANAVAHGAGVVGKHVAQLGTAFILLSAADKALAKHNAQQIAKAKGGDPTVALAQLALGMEQADQDGKMGQKTSDWISDFQSEKGLPETGKLDPATIKALGI